MRIFGGLSTYDQLLRAQRESAQGQLERLVRKATARGVQVSAILIDVGVPAERIVRVAKARHALLGSVATRVIATAGCPVLTVRA
jgi:nucleotide-binding universal stress UspA family protein